MKYLSRTLFIIVITALFGIPPSYGEEPLEIIPLPEIESPPPALSETPVPSPEPLAEPAEPEKTTDVYVAPTPAPKLPAPISAPRTKLDDSVGREHDLWDPDFLLQPEPEIEEIENKGKGYLERSYFGISRRVVHLANSVDSIFGDRRATDEYDGSTLRVTQGATISKNSFTTNDLSLSLNLQLPNLQSMEKRMRQSLEKDLSNSNMVDDE